MRFKLIFALAASLLVVACESTPEAVEEDDSAGQAVDLTEDTMVDVDPIDPRSERYVQEVLGDRVFFALDSSVLNARAQTSIRRWAEWMTEFSEVIVVVEGHCDERGTREYNLALGDRRANAVKDHFVVLGIDPNRIATISYGKERPAILGHTEAAWGQNRRGVLTLS
jgi:peptidoglycan-associated lipoprotein